RDARSTSDPADRAWVTCEPNLASRTFSVISDAWLVQSAFADTNRFSSGTRIDPAGKVRSATATKRLAPRSLRARMLRTNARTTASAMSTCEAEIRRRVRRIVGGEVPASLVTSEGRWLNASNLSHVVQRMSRARKDDLRTRP